MKKKIPVFESDEQAISFLKEIDLTEYDLSPFKPKLLGRLQMMAIYGLMGLAIIISAAILLLIIYPKKWLVDAVEWIFAEQAIVVLFAWICTMLAVFLLIYPVINYLRTNQNRRIEIIKGFHTPKLIKSYFWQFRMGRDDIRDLFRKSDQLKASVDSKAKAKLDSEFEAKFNEIIRDEFGFGCYQLSFVVLVVVAFIVMFFAFTGGFSLAAKLAGRTDILEPPLGIPIDLISIAAIFGAYIWVTSDAISRNYNGALHASDLSWYALRLIIAVPLGQAISMAAGTDAKSGQLGAGWAAFLAFFISMFSLDRINQILGSVANRALNLPALAPAEQEDVVIRLPGVDQRVSNLLGAEGVTTIAQVVAADPVRLSLRAALPFYYVLSLVDAGILWKFVGNKLVTGWCKFGLTGASSVLDCPDFSSSAQLETILDKAAKVKELKTALEKAAAEQPQPDPAAQQAPAAGEALDQAEADLRAACDRPLLSDIAKKTEVEVSGIERIFASIKQELVRQVR